MSSGRRAMEMALHLAAAAPVAACAKPVPDSEPQASAGARQASAAGPSSRPSIGSDGTAGVGLTLRQFEQRREQSIMAADTDHGGKVSHAEFMASMTAGKGSPVRRFARLDRNGDGFVDRPEIGAATARRFGKLDTGGDGRVSRQERKSGMGTVSASIGRAAADDAG